MCPLPSPSRRPLSRDDRKALLEIARSAISFAVAGERPLEIVDLGGALSVQCGAFVTLRARGRLRGCIGRLSAFEPLAETVARSASDAAMNDPRFSPLLADELGRIEIEISVLSTVQTAQPSEVQPGLHGLVISRDGHRGALLPQVARNRRWSRERFLEEACLKANLPTNAWQDPGTRIEIFTAESFSESDFRAGSPQSAPARS